MTKPHSWLKTGACARSWCKLHKVIVTRMGLPRAPCASPAQRLLRACPLPALRRPSGRGARVSSLACRLGARGCPHFQAAPLVRSHLKCRISVPFPSFSLAINTPLLGSEVECPFQCSIISGWHSTPAALWFLAVPPRASGCFSCRTRPLAPTCECKFLTYAAVAPRVDRSASVAMMTVAHRRFSHR